MASKSRALEYVDDQGPGITRKKATHGWAYFDPDGKRITDRDEIDRLNRIALPPAYTDAWFCPKDCGHLLATGIDARGRKQYREIRVPTGGAEKFDGVPRSVVRSRKAEARRERPASRALFREQVVAAESGLDSAQIRVGKESTPGRTELRATTRASGKTRSPAQGQVRFKAKTASCARRDQRCTARRAGAQDAGSAGTAPVPVYQR